MSTQREFWSDIGRTSDDGGTLQTLLGTPNAHPRTHSPRQVDHGIQLANQVQNGLISSVAASPASLFQWRDVEKGMVMNAGCGQLFAEFSNCSDQATCLSKTSQGYSQLMLDGSQSEYSGTLLFLQA